MLNCFAKARDVMSARKTFDSMHLLGLAPNLQVGGRQAVTGFVGIE